VRAVRPADRRQRGAITLGVVVGALVLSAAMIGAVTVGRIAAIRSDVQRAADAAALAALEVVRERGLSAAMSAQSAAETVGRGNSALDVRFFWRLHPTDDAVTIEVTARADAPMPRLLGGGDLTEISATARAVLSQRRFDRAERRQAKLVLVLDYSGSMTAPFSGGSGRAIDVLEQSVTGLLDRQLEIEYGAVFYSTSVFRTVPTSPAAPNQVAAVMNAYDAGGTTNTAAALAMARNVLLSSQDTGRFVLLVSDGQPCCDNNSFGRARTAAEALWDSGATIWTLEIRRRDSGAALDQFMTDVAGAPGQRHDRDFHYVASSSEDLGRLMGDVAGQIVCTVGPIEPAPTEPASLRVFLADGGGERLLPYSTDFRDDNRQRREAYEYDAAQKRIRLTAAACAPVREGAAEIVVRHDRPALSL